MCRKLFSFLLLLCFTLQAEEILWSGSYVSLVEKDGIAAICMNRSADLDHLSQSEKIAMEETVGKMHRVFESVFGFGDFVRWMPLGEKALTSYLIPSGAYAAEDEVDIDLKIRVMLLTLKEKKELLPPLSEKHLEAIKHAAKEILPQVAKPFQLRESNLLCTKIKEGLVHLFKELNQPFDETVVPDFKPSFTTDCRAFCNPRILQAQKVFSSSLHCVLYNNRPYVLDHLMVIPHRHVTSVSESSEEEIIDKYALFSQIAYVIQNQNVAVVTRMGWRAGQTQAHLHDHVVGFDPSASQAWISNWASELKGQKITVDPTSWEIERTRWEKALMPLEEIN